MKPAEYREFLVEKYGLTLKEAKLVAKHCDKERCEAVSTLSVSELENDFWRSDAEVKRAREEMEQNPQYIEASETLKLLKSSLKEATEPFRALNVFRLAQLQAKKDK